MRLRHPGLIFKVLSQRDPAIIPGTVSAQSANKPPVAESSADDAPCLYDDESSNETLASRVIAATRAVDPVLGFRFGRVGGLVGLCHKLRCPHDRVLSSPDLLGILGGGTQGGPLAGSAHRSHFWSQQRDLGSDLRAATDSIVECADAVDGICGGRLFHYRSPRCVSVIGRGAGFAARCE